MRRNAARTPSLIWTRIRLGAMNSNGEIDLLSNIDLPLRFAHSETALSGCEWARLLIIWLPGGALGLFLPGSDAPPSGGRLCGREASR